MLQIVKGLSHLHMALHLLQTLVQTPQHGVDVVALGNRGRHVRTQTIGRLQTGTQQHGIPSILFVVEALFATLFRHRTERRFGVFGHGATGSFHNVSQPLLFVLVLAAPDLEHEVARRLCMFRQFQRVGWIVDVHRPILVHQMLHILLSTRR